MQNPLLNNNIITTIDTITNTEITVDILNVGKYFKNVYCLCPFTKFDYSILNEKTIDIDKYNNAISKMVLYKCKINLLKNMIHFGNIMYCENQHIIRANHFEYELEEMILVIPFFNISFLNLQKYIDSVNGNDNLDKLFDIMTMYGYFGENTKKLSNVLKYENIIKNLNETMYWKHEYNCLCNITKLFDKRQFNFTILKKSSSDHINKVITNLNITSIRENYLEEIFKKRNYVDPSSIINKKGFRFYNVVKNCKYNMNDINTLFDNITSENQKFLLFTQLAISREYCHLVIANSRMLDSINKYMPKYFDLYEYIFGHAWVRFYFEESISKYNMKTNDLFIFDINTASKLPVFHFDYMNPHKNPYMPILVGNYSLNPTNNIGGVQVNGTDHRICTLDEFKQRFNIFTTNNIKYDLFQGIDFVKYKMGITGSIMTACLQYKHPLLKLFETPTINMTDLYNRFYNEYYCTADIDVMIRTNDMIEFLEIGKKIHKDITNNILLYYDYSETSHVKLVTVKQIYLFVTKDFITTCIIPNMVGLTLDMVITNMESIHVKSLFEKYAEILHKKEVETIMEKYTVEEQTQFRLEHPEYFIFSIHDIIIKIYDKTLNTTMVKAKTQTEYTEEQLEKIIEEGIVDDDNTSSSINMTDGISISTSYKIRISAPQLDHELEIFPIKKDDFMTTIGCFHMPCVRAYYDGSNVYMTPSCISSHLTYMNIDYKYFAGSKDPLEIINKYRMRGFGTWLNKSEITTFIKYSSMVPFWNNLYNIDLNKQLLVNTVGSLPITNKLFYPRQFNIDYYTNPNLKPSPFDEPYVDINVVPSYNRMEYNIKRFNATNMNTIFETVSKMKNEYIDSTTGYIIPIQPNFIDMISHMFNSS